MKGARKVSKRNSKKRLEPKPSTVYIGPSLPGLAQYTVFRNGQWPAHVKARIEGNDTIAQLIVPATRLQAARSDVQTPGHILNFYAKQLLKG